MRLALVKIKNMVLKTVMLFLMSFLLVILLFATASKLDIISRDSILSGFDYIPSLWIFVASLPVTVSLLFLSYRRTAFIFFGVFTLFFLFFGDYSLPGNNSDESDFNQHDYVELSVMTFNVRYYSSGINRIIEFLNRSNNDIYLLTESVLTPETIDYINIEMPEYTLLSDGGKDVSILSKYPVLHYNIVELPTYSASLSGGNDIDELSKNSIYRAFVHCIIIVRGVPVNVLSVRLIAGRPKDNSLSENLKWGKYLLKAQMEELEILLSYIHSLDGPIIFGGDLNSSASSSIVRRIRDIADDAYFSDHIFGGFTFSTSFPFTRLDYLFHSKDVITSYSNVVDSYLSDHFPVEAKFHIKVNPGLANK